MEISWRRPGLIFPLDDVTVNTLAKHSSYGEQIDECVAPKFNRQKRINSAALPYITLKGLKGFRKELLSSLYDVHRICPSRLTSARHRKYGRIYADKFVLVQQLFGTSQWYFSCYSYRPLFAFYLGIGVTKR